MAQGVVIEFKNQLVRSQSSVVRIFSTDNTQLTTDIEPFQRNVVKVTKPN